MVYTAKRISPIAAYAPQSDSTPPLISTFSTSLVAHRLGIVFVTELINARTEERQFQSSFFPNNAHIRLFLAFSVTVTEKC